MKIWPVVTEVCSPPTKVKVCWSFRLYIWAGGFSLAVASGAFLFRQYLCYRKSPPVLSESKLTLPMTPARWRQKVRGSAKQVRWHVEKGLLQASGSGHVWSWVMRDLSPPKAAVLSGSPFSRGKAPEAQPLTLATFVETVLMSLSDWF